MNMHMQLEHIVEAIEERAAIIEQGGGLLDPSFALDLEPADAADAALALAVLAQGGTVREASEVLAAAQLSRTQNPLRVKTALGLLRSRNIAKGTTIHGTAPANPDRKHPR